MEHAAFVEQIRTQAEALRAVAVRVDPAAPVPTCPGWDVRRLVGHIAQIHAMSAQAVAAGAAEGSPQLPILPEDWDELFIWWDDQRAILLRRLAEAHPDSPAMPFGPPASPTVGFWSRRIAHETAIHRLDAEHAGAARIAPAAVPTLAFDPEFAADGIDEMLTMILPRGDWSESKVAGTALCHAADAGRAWTVLLDPGAPPHASLVRGVGVDSDAVVAGTADALYRAVWGRPNTAVISGDTALAAVVKPRPRRQ